MIALFTVLVALPLGYLVRNRLAASLAYGLATAWLYVFQTTILAMEWVDGSDEAFQGSDWAGTWGYLLVTSVVYAAGFGLVALGHRLRGRRDARRTVVELEPA